MMRVFVSVDITNTSLIHGITRIQKESGLDGPTRPENMHFTLIFLGEMNESKILEVEKLLQGIKFDSFTIRCMGLGSFSLGKKGKIVWMGVDKYSQRMLTDLATRTFEALEPLGIRKIRKFHPHTTIFRVKNKLGDTANVLKQFENVKFGVQMVNSIRLKSSVLTSSYAIYKDLLVVDARK